MGDIKTDKTSLYFGDYFIINSSKEEDTVLDMFMGSGSTGESALLLKRKFVGIELNPSYFETAKTRLAQVDKEILKTPELKVA
jgi:site-specific DNA-methyltransferase (adenine-specific)